jgi:adhesin transport system outer membrane protein
VYANILRYRELVNLAERNLKTHERIYGQIKLKSDSGIGRQSDLSQITARLSKAHANYFAAINNLTDAESNYKNIVGEMPPKDLIYPVPDKDLLPQDLDSAINESLKKNPAIEGAKWDVMATESSQKIIDADNYPSVNFVLERTWNNNIDGDEGPSEDLLAMIRLNYNLYSGGTHKRKKEAAVQQNVRASEIRRKTIRDTELTVRLAWAAYKATTGQKEHIRQYVIATKESQVAYEKQFRLGRRTLLDVLDSENELFQARQDYVNADYDELFSEFRLFNAKGEIMRAFRIYRPQLLGFNDEFDKAKAPPAPEPTATDELEAAESAVKVDDTPQPPETKPVNLPEKTQENDLFLDADENSGSW